MCDNWLQSLRAGDLVVVSNGTQRWVDKVERVTPTQVLVRHNRYRCEDGRLVGDLYSGLELLEPTTGRLTEAREEMERRRCITVVRDCNPHVLTTEQLQALVRIIRG